MRFQSYITKVCSNSRILTTVSPTHETEEDRLWYEIFFSMCRKFNVSWRQATKKQKAFIEEIARVNFEREMAKRNGLPANHIRGFFDRPTVA